MNDEETFFMLDILIRRYGLEKIYSPNLNELKKILYIFLNLEKNVLPEVYNILYKKKIYPCYYASGCFLNLFNCNLDFNFSSIIFDTFLFEGFKVIFRFALAIIKFNESKIIHSDSTLLFIEKYLMKEIDMDKLRQIAYNLKFSRQMIWYYAAEYEKVKDDYNNEFISQIINGIKE